jgi:endonuclease/exonuclease/phosphatase family metal-dependent hydrolase
MTSPDGPPTLRLLTYNVRSLRDDADAVARVIRAAEPHVVCIQEAPRLFRWRAKCAALSRRCGLVIVTGGGTAAGNLIMSSLGVDLLAHRDVLLTRDRGLHQRGVALADLRWRGHRFAIASTHLDLEPDARLRHIGELEQAFDQFADATAAKIVVGDLNDEPGSATWTALSKSRTDVYSAIGVGEGFTFTAANPKRRIDAVFVDPSITVRSATVLDGPHVAVGSDHRPVLVELAF